MEAEGVPTTEKKRGRKAKVRECEASGQPTDQWCWPCQSGHRKRPCQGLKIEVEVTAATTSAILSKSTIASTEIDASSDLSLPSTGTRSRPVRGFAGKNPERLEYPPDQIRNKCWAGDHDQATRRKISTKKQDPQAHSDHPRIADRIRPLFSRGDRRSEHNFLARITNPTLFLTLRPCQQ